MPIHLRNSRQTLDFAGGGVQLLLCRRAICARLTSARGVSDWMAGGGCLTDSDCCVVNTEHGELSG